MLKASEPTEDEMVEMVGKPPVESWETDSEGSDKDSDDFRTVMRYDVSYSMLLRLTYRLLTEFLGDVETGRKYASSDEEGESCDWMTANAKGDENGVVVVFPRGYTRGRKCGCTRRGCWAKICSPGCASPSTRGTPSP
jgi:hypothetical protein